MAPWEHTLEQHHTGLRHVGNNVAMLVISFLFSINQVFMFRCKYLLVLVLLNKEEHVRLLEYSREGSTRGFKTRFSEIQRKIKSHTHTCIIIPSAIFLNFTSYMAFVDSANFSVIA